MNAEAKNLERISTTIDEHNAECAYPAKAVVMNPYEVERLGWDTIRGLPILSDPAMGSGMFRLICDADTLDLEESVEAVSSQPVIVSQPA